MLLYPTARHRTKFRHLHINDACNRVYPRREKIKISNKADRVDTKFPGHFSFVKLIHHTLPLRNPNILISRGSIDHFISFRTLISHEASSVKIRVSVGARIWRKNGRVVCLVDTRRVALSLISYPERSSAR